MYIAENLKVLRKDKEWTQEEMAEMIGVSPQSVSKWERGDTYPDITLLPALANLYKVSVDSIIGMDKINEAEARNAVFTSAHEHLRAGDGIAAAKTLTEALKTFPADESIMSELALVLALESDPEKLKQAADLCERVLAGNPTEKVRHTTRAAICFIYFKLGEKERAMTAIGNLPHVRESREKIQEELLGEPRMDDVNAYLRFIAIGDEMHREKITITHGLGMGDIFTIHRLIERISELKKELAAQSSGEGKLPHFVGLMYDGIPSGLVKVTYCGVDYLDKEFSDSGEATEEVLLALRKIAQR